MSQLTFITSNYIIRIEVSAMKMKKEEKRLIYVLCLILALIIAFSAGVVLSKNNQNAQKATQAETQKTTQITESTTAFSEVVTSKISDETTAISTSTDAVTQSTAAYELGTINNPYIITINESLWHLTLVNSSCRIPDTYTPDLVAVCGSNERLDRKVALEYEKMYAAALNDGVVLKPCSGYRSYELQERNYKNKIKFFENQGYSTEDAKVKAATIIMPPGSSEHNLGYAMDIVCVEEWFENTNEFRWLTENAADYGFIMRYPKDKQDITKVIYEPWHWRYVGVEAAKEMKEKNLTLEEYLGVY